MAADGEDGEEDCRARAASRQLISGEESEATASGLAATFDLCGEGRSGARARRRRRRRLRCRGREKGKGILRGRFTEKSLTFSVILNWSNMGFLRDILQKSHPIFP